MLFAFIPIAVAVVMDFFSIAAAHVAGWLGITGFTFGFGFAEESVNCWPGADVIVPLVTGRGSCGPVEVAGSTFEVLVVGLLCTFIPPMPFANVSDLPVRTRFSRKLRGYVLDGFVDALLVVVICMLVGFFFTVGPKRLYDGPFAWFVGIVLGGGSVVLAGGLAAVALGVIQTPKTIDSSVTFKVLVGVGKYALVTAALTIWSVNNIDGWISIILCFVANCIFTSWMATL